MKRVLIRTALVAGIGMLLSWLALGNLPAFSDWLLVHPAVTNAASAANLPAFVLAAVVSGNVHAPSGFWLVASAVVQWLVNGLAIASISTKLWPNNSSKPTPLRGAA